MIYNKSCMIYKRVPFPRFQGNGVTTDALVVLCAQLMHDLFAIANFLSYFGNSYASKLR